VPIDIARGYFEVSATGQPEACPPTLFGGGTAPSDITAGVSGTGGGSVPPTSPPSSGGGGPVASPN